MIRIIQSGVKSPLLSPGESKVAEKKLHDKMIVNSISGTVCVATVSDDPGDCEIRPSGDIGRSVLSKTSPPLSVLSDNSKFPQSAISSKNVKCTDIIHTKPINQPLNVNQNKDIKSLIPHPPVTKPPTNVISEILPNQDAPAGAIGQCGVDQGTRVDVESPVITASTELQVNAVSNSNLSLSLISSEGEGPVSEENEGLRLFYANCRGYSSKRESISQIVSDQDSDIVILTETNFKGHMHPKLPNYCSFFRNREILNMGGVAILVKEKYKNYAVRSKVGKGVNEFMIVKLNCFSPKLAILAMYGSQKSEGAAVVETNIHEIFFEVKECQAAGYAVMVVGDTNIQLGRELIENNDMMVSKAGNLFNEYTKECGLVAANNLSPNPATFVRGNLSRVLDVVLVEDAGVINSFTTDSDQLEFTPFTVKTKKTGETFRVHADHRAIKWSMKIKMVKPDSKLPPVWMYNKALGDQKFDVLTDDGAEWAIDMCEDGVGIDEIVDKIDKFIEKSKFKAYGKRTLSRKKKEKWNEKRMWAARFNLVNKLAKEFESEKDNIKIWRARKIAVGSSDNQTSSLRDYRTGEMLDDLDEMTEMLLQYNQDTMDKEKATAEADLIRGMKEDVLEDLLNDVSDFPQSISWEIYMKVINKIMKQKKGVLRDFIKSGPAFKCAVYVILNTIYSSEKIPKIFKKTILTKLWKRKGSVNDIANHRFIHGRHWLGKIYEKCLVEIIAQDQFEATPDFQLGGIPGKSTREHLMAAMLIIKAFNTKNKSIPILLCDIRKCFDKLVLNDLVYDSAVSGADLKAVKMLKAFHEDFEIVMASDNSDNPRSRMIPKTAGQGTNAAPGWAGNSQAQTVDKHVDFELCAKVGETQTKPKAFVDDIMVIPGDANKARQMGPQITRAFDELSIKIHEDKTVIIVPGGMAAAKKMRSDLTQNPMMIQGNPIKIAEKDLYLGMTIHQGGVKDSIEATFNQRKGKAWAKVPVIKSLLNHPQLLNEGWLGAAVAIIQGIIPPTMLYSSETWMDLTKRFVKNMEANYKAMVYAILEIPTHTNYAAVLAETGLMKMKHMMNKARICYANHVLWTMGDCEVRKLLLEDQKLRGEKSHLAVMVDLAKSYGLPDFTTIQLDGDLLKRRVKEVNDDELLKAVLSSKSAEKRVWLRLRVKPHFKWPKMEARARILEAAGGFRFLAQASGWKTFYRARQISSRCVSRLCTEDDTASHAKECPFMNTKWMEKFEDDNKLKAEYYVKLNKERRRRFGFPIL